MDTIQFIKDELAAGKQLSDLLAYVPEDFNLDDFIKTNPPMEIPEVRQPVQPGTTCFEIITNPDAEYQGDTNLIDISGLTDFMNYNSVTDGNLTVSFNTAMEKFSPSIWWLWGNPPYVENSNPPVLFSGYYINTITLNLSQPCCEFGCELMPNLLFPMTCTAEFFSANKLVGTISVTTPANARLFAAKTCCSSLFDTVVLSIPDPFFGFAIADIRYSTDCESNCCCSIPTPVTIPACQDSITLPLTETEVDCTGRLLNVDVTVTACEKRSVIVGVIVCDPTGKTVLRFKASEACMPPTTVIGQTCVTKTFNFCFVFQEDLCTAVPLSVKTIVEYTSFDFPCTC